MVMQNEEFIPRPVCGIEIFDFVIAFIYIAIPIAMTVIALRSDMPLTRKLLIAATSVISCIVTGKTLVDFLGVFEYVHCKTNFFNHPFGVQKMTLYQSIRLFETNTFSMASTILTILSVILVIIHGCPRN